MEGTQPLLTVCGCDYVLMRVHGDIEVHCGMDIHCPKCKKTNNNVHFDSERPHVWRLTEAEDKLVRMALGMFIANPHGALPSAIDAVRGVLVARGEKVADAIR